MGRNLQGNCEWIGHNELSYGWGVFLRNLYNVQIFIREETSRVKIIETQKGYSYERAEKDKQGYGRVCCPSVPAKPLHDAPQRWSSG